MIGYIFLVVLAKPAHSAYLGWSYEDESNWAGLCANGKQQSPIAINSSLAVPNPQLNRMPLKFNAFTGNATGRLFNTGYSIQFTVDKASLASRTRPFITGCGLGGPTSGGYLWEQFHLHWGRGLNDTAGSEHVIDGRSAPAELHLMFYSRKYYSYSQALNYSNGVAGLAFFLEPTTINNTNEANVYTELFDMFGQDFAEDTNISTLIDFAKLVPPWVLDSQNTIYYRYNGSFTTPPCFEGVSWTVFDRPIKVPKDSFQKLWLSTKRHINASANLFDVLPLVGTNRNVKPIDGRVVWTNKFIGTEDDISSAVLFDGGTNNTNSTFLCGVNCTSSYSNRTEVGNQAGCLIITGWFHLALSALLLYFSALNLN